jgi:hypothetical protein
MIPVTPASSEIPQVHFRREKTATPATAAALARMILAAQAAFPKGNK